MEAYSDDTNDGYIIEFKIPWTTLKHDSVQPGDTIGFEVIVNDDDGIYGFNEYIDHRILWHANTTGAYQDPSLFGTIVLAVAPGIVATPVISPDIHLNDDSVVVEITAETEGASIYYTTDGSDPDEASNLYTGPFTIYENTYIMAIAIKEGMENSEIAIQDYDINIQSVNNNYNPDEFSVVSLPGQGQVKLTINNEFHGAVQIDLFDQAIKPYGSYTHYLNMPGHPHGVYLVKITQNLTSKHIKFLY